MDRTEVADSKGGMEKKTVYSDRYRELFEMLLEAIPSSVLLIDRDLRIVRANKNFVEKSRRTRSTVMGRKLEAVLPAAIVERADMAGRVCKVFESKRPTLGERLTYRAPGIPIRIYYYRILPFLLRERVEMAVLLMDDVTERVRLSEEVRRIERHLASVVESAWDVVLSTDSRGRVLTWNSAAERLTAFTLEEVRGTLLGERCVPEQRGKLESILETIRSTATSTTGELDLVTRKGGRIPIDWVFSPMKDESTHDIGIVAVGRDLSEQRKLEHQLLQSHKLAALGVMAGGIAHEIRNPLAICSSAAQFLQDEEITSEFRKECVERVLAGVQRASVIIENLLRFARPAAPTTEMRELDLVPLIQEALGLVANQAKIQKVLTSLRLSSERVLISGNPELLRQVLLNLLLNAINAMADGGHLQISVEKGGGEVFVRVADTGQGIPEESIEKVFDPFYTMSPVGQGTGLGLSICYSIIKQHFGSIEVTSLPDKGTEFTVRLPTLG